MELLYKTQTESNQIEIYNEYLRKIPELLKQLKSVEKMYEKALLEEAMLADKEANASSALYADRLRRTKKQCEIRSADIREQCKLIFELKAQIEAECSVITEILK